MAGRISEHKLLDPSELGTRDYWESAYTTELRNHEEDADDEGTVWFSESNAEDAILKQLNSLADKGLLSRNGSGASRFIDLGTGNGHLLFTLREEDDDGECWEGEMVGVDYSSTSIQLANRIAEQRQSHAITFETWDLLSEPAGPWLHDGFDMALDKGTFDAISLMMPAEGTLHPCEMYGQSVVLLVKPGGFLMVTSCNWTKEELLQWLVTSDGELDFYDEVKYPTFTFGGQTGQSIVTIVFRRR